MSAGASGGDGSPSPFRFVGLGFEIVVPLIAGVWLGRVVDRWLDTTPWFLLGGTLLGMAAGFLNFFRAALPRRSGPGGEAP